MADSRTVNGWVASILGDALPHFGTDHSYPQQKVQRLSQDLRHGRNTHHQVTSLPNFEGKYDPDSYIDWEIEVEEIFGSHDFSEHKKINDVTKSFFGFASVWWRNYCRENIYNRPTTWKALKLVMRNRFVPSYHASDFLRKLQRLAQGNDTVEKYYHNLCVALFRCGLKECEEDFLNRFWRGLNHDIQDKIMHEELYYVDHLFRFSCEVEHKLRRGIYKINKGAMEPPSKKVASFDVTPTTIAPLGAYEESPSTILTSYQLGLQGNKEGV